MSSKFSVYRKIEILHLKLLTDDGRNLTIFFRMNWFPTSQQKKSARCRIPKHYILGSKQLIQTILLAR